MLLLGWWVCDGECVSVWQLSGIVWFSLHQYECVFIVFIYNSLDINSMLASSEAQLKLSPVSQSKRPL